jgi:hypothetical protein
MDTHALLWNEYAFIAGQTAPPRRRLEVNL